MRKFAFIAMMAASVLFVQCTKENENKKEEEPAKEVSRVLEDFENGGMLSWNGSNGCSFEIVANPVSSDANKSATVGKYTTAEAQWDFVWTTGFGAEGEGESATYDFLNFSADGYIIKVDVYAPAAGIPIYCKLEGVDVSSMEITTVATTKAYEWETLEFDFEPKGMVDGAYKNFVFCVDAGGTTAGTVVYMDNVREVAGE